MTLEKIKNFIKKTKDLFIVLFIFIIISLPVFFFSNNDSPDNAKIIFSIANEIDKYYLTWVEFQRLSGQDIVNKWNEKYFYCKYKLNGNSKEDKFDCFSSIFFLLKDLGSNIKLQKVEELYKELNIYSIKRKNIKKIKEKDFIIIFIKNNWHIGIVVRIYQDKIYYVDVNIADNGFGYKDVNFNNKIIKGIYPISFKIWIGDLLDKYIEIEK